MPNVSFRAALLAGAVAFASIAGFVLSGGPAGAQDATTNTETTTPAPAEAAPTGTPAPSANGAPTPADPAEVVATVNGKPITRQDVLDSAADLPPQYMAQIDKLFPQLLNRLIGIQLVEAKGREQGLADDPEVKKLVKQAEEEAISRAYIQKVIETKVNDEAIQKIYDEDLKEHPPQIEIRASHILVKTEDEAKEIIKQLQGGADFATLAKEKSIDKGSGEQGGDLNWFTKDTMVKEFSDAAFAMQRGDVSKVPVKSQFGWHIIKITDSRMQTPAPLEARKDDIRQALSQEAVHQEVQGLIGGAKIEYSKEDYKLPLAPTGAPQ
ncbi:peptidylprolyl isomerase [Dongia sedimenti]|uniref:Parvulin-like PPIase n=1 Tax=Dongia sedimenti TaxID=3064282 RepID=A0ABU0YMU1_9PROT|nr:peptidylprolyl isomerase [Rhodospirillaceae bacterium R-7]